MDLGNKLYNIFHNQIVGGSVVLIKNENEIKYNYGYSSLIEKKFVEDETIYRIASISKATMVILKLVEDGLLDLDDDISTILGYKVQNPKYPNVPITTRMLLHHTSSITDGLDNDELEKGYNRVNGHHYFVSLEDLLSNQNSKYYTDKTFSDYAPGEKYIYSNFGAGILACIIEKCSNELFTEYVERWLFKPLEMDASFKASKIIKKDKISDAFTNFNTKRTAQEFIESTYPDYPLGNNFRGPAGGLFVSMQDLSKIMIALMNDGKYKDVEVLKKETVDKLFNMNIFASRYYQEKDIWIKGYTGGAYGISTVMYFSLDKKTGICFAANGGNYKPVSTGLNNIQEQIIDVLVNEL